MAQFTNQATLSYNGVSINSNTVTGNILEVLAVTKTAIRDSYAADETITYVVSITNSGTAAVTGLTLTDTLGAYPFDGATVTPLDYSVDSITYYQNGVLQTAPTITATDPLTVTNLSVPAGGNAILVYEVRPNALAPLGAGSTITNQVSLTGASLVNPVTASETVAVLNQPRLSITKSLNPVNVTENSEITYTFTIQNTGNTPAEADENIVIADTFDPILSDITVTVNGTVLSATSYSYDETTGEFSTDAGVITVPAATYSQDPNTGIFSTTPGVTTVTVTGRI